MVMSVPLPPREGIGHYVWNLSRYLVRQGHEVQIITRGGLGGLQHETRGGITIWRPTFVPFYPWHVHLHGLFVQRLITRTESSVDVFHSHSPLPPVIKTRRPILLTVHTPVRANSRSIPLRNIPSLLVKLQAPVSFGLEQELFKRAARITAVATSVANELREYGIDPSQVPVSGVGVDTTVFSPNQGRSDAPPYALAAGRLGLRKGFEDLIECARIVRTHIPDLRFLIAGSGPFESMLRAKIRKDKLDDSVELLGHIDDRQRMAALYRQAAMFIHPAHYEGLPAVLLEAMACGLPVVTTAVGGIAEVIQQERNGMLVPPHDPAEMAAVILRIFSDPQLAERLGNAARDTVEARYSWQAVGALYAQLYRQLAEVA